MVNLDYNNFSFNKDPLDNYNSLYNINYYNKNFNYSSSNNFDISLMVPIKVMSNNYIDNDIN